MICFAIICNDVICIQGKMRRMKAAAGFSAAATK